MCIHDLSGVLLYINPAAAESLGYCAGEGVGRNLADFLAPQVRSLLAGYLERIHREGSDTGFMRMLARDGTEQTWLYRNRLHQPAGGDACVLGHAQNVTSLIRKVSERNEELQRSNERLRREMQERHKVEEELLQARKMESLGVLAGGIAHDFNNILTAIAGNLALARLEAGPEGTLSEVLADAERACARASGLSLQLLTFAKGGAPVRRASSLGEIASESAASVLQGSACRLELHVPADLWPVDVDPGQISQVIQNVVLNAAQAMPEGGAVEVRAENADVASDALPLPAGRYVRLTVHDRGHGISPEDLPRIFDPYFSTRRGGRGLGLATAYAVVHKHQGHIAAESSPGHGTRVVLYLPAAVESAREAGMVQGPGCGSGRILVMDDEDLIRELSRKALGRLGYEVVCAADGAEAVALYRAAVESGRPFRAVVLDLTVPGGMGGVESLRRMRQIDPRVKAIVSSGYSDDPVMASAAEYGFLAVVPKPWTIASLSRVLQRVLEQ